jgi:hypothetical protein
MHWSQESVEKTGYTKVLVLIASQKLERRPGHQGASRTFAAAYRRKFGLEEQFERQLEAAWIA